MYFQFINRQSNPNSNKSRTIALLRESNVHCFITEVIPYFTELNENDYLMRSFFKNILDIQCIL